MTLIDSYAFFTTPKAIFLHNLLNPKMSYHTLQKVSSTFNDRYEIKYINEALNSPTLVKITPKTYKGERSNYSNKHSKN